MNNNQSVIVLDGGLIHSSVTVWNKGKEVFRESDWPAISVNLLSIFENEFSDAIKEKIKSLDKFEDYIWVLVLAGVTSEIELEEIKLAWKRFLYLLGVKVKEIIIISDIELVVWSGSEVGEGIGLIADTSSGAIGRLNDGKVIKVGDMSYLLSDEGSSFALGWKALRVLRKMSDGRLVKSSFYNNAMKKFGFVNMLDLNNYLFTSPNQKEEIALFAPLVLEYASFGDRVLEEIVISELEELVSMVETINKMFRSNGLLPVFVSGSLFKNHFYLSNFERLLHEKFSNQTVKTVSVLDGVFNLLNKSY